MSKAGLVSFSEFLPLHIVMRILVLAIVCGVVFATSICRGEDPYVSVPVALSVDDGHKELSEVFLECRVRRYSIPAADFVKAAASPEEKALARIINFAQGGSHDSLPDDLLPSDVDQKVRDRALQLPERLGKFINNCTVIAMIHVGESRVFIIEISDPSFARPGQQSGRLKLVMIKTENGWRWDGFTKKELIFSVILDSFNHDIGTDSIFSIHREDLRFEYTLPTTAKGSPVQIQFNGRSVDVDVFAQEPEVEADDPIMEFYVNVWRSFRDDLMSFPKYWDISSRAKITDMLIRKTSEERTQFQEQMISGGRTAWFIIEAGPTWVVFAHSIHPRIANFESIREQPGSNDLQMYGYGKLGFGERLLASKDIEQILEQAAEKCRKENKSSNVITMESESIHGNNSSSVSEGEESNGMRNPMYIVTGAMLFVILAVVSRKYKA